MWSEVVKPILDVLGFSRVDQSVGQVPPRIWWCPTGDLSFLPIHAAGIYGGLNREGTMDYVTSSYTPTVAALAERIKAGPTPSGDTLGLLLTSQPNAPGSTPIPGMTKEVQTIYAKATELGTRALMVEGGTLTVDTCVKFMEEYSSVHFACHASQNAADPLQSRFLLEDGHSTLQRSSDWT
ncbi:hypothetical protein D9611_001091 [Ephemerocybe angulata]|uniref:CHAT domain-containing protein n=1 Tax=Ephemerocybe angulata TaxID=980116 RepID=A0A8H5CJS4_9AGAR|nr:hypothetical protein D9611_001091 [Tulosesus angulatus]